MLIDDADALGLLGTVDLMPTPRQVLLTTPKHFEVAYEINPHMRGNAGTVDGTQAQRQWDQLHRAYRRLGFIVHTLEGHPGLPDMVFCANQTLPFLDAQGHRPTVFLSKMARQERRQEVDLYHPFFAQQGYQVAQFDEAVQQFEGMGDALWHPGRWLLWGGHGFRTDATAYEAFPDALPILRLHLSDPDFYHLDTCLCLLDPETALIAPEAFDATGLALLSAFFPRLIEAPSHEARQGFACNAHCPDGTHVLIEAQCTETQQLLFQAGFQPIPVDTREFLKAGGSVFCMKQMFW